MGWATWRVLVMVVGLLVLDWPALHAGAAGAPVVTVPASIDVPATSYAGAAVSYAVSAVDGAGAPLSPWCTSPSGSTFGPGTTTVVCDAWDGVTGLTGEAQFTVTVEPYCPPTPLDGIYPRAVLADDPIAYFRLDDGCPQLVRDATGHGLDGTASGAIQWPYPGALVGDGDPAFYFVGTNTNPPFGMITVPDPDAALSPKGAITLEAWLQFFGGQNDRYTIFEKPANYKAELRQCAPDAYALCVSYFGVVQTRPIDFRNWHHVVWESDGEWVAIYVDGQPQAISGATQTAFHDPIPLPLTIGGDAGGAFFNGAIDEVAVYDHALSADQVLAHYRAGGGVTPPSITTSVNPPPNDFGWRNQPVTVTFNCAAATLPIASCSPPVTLGDDGVGQSAKGSAVDTAGNQVSATVGGINVDRTPPRINPLVPPSNAAGWYNQPLAVGFDCQDDLSGVAQCPPAAWFDEGRMQGATGVAVDRAGNQAAANIVGVNVDRTPPVTAFGLSGDRANGDLFRGPVTVSLTAQDNLSGVAATFFQVDGGATQPYTGLQVIQTPGTHALRFWSVDAADNAEAAQSVSFSIDTAGPHLQLPAPIWLYTSEDTYGYGWNLESDEPLASSSCDPASGSAFPIGTTTVVCTGTDLAGNTSTGSFDVTIVKQDVGIVDFEVNPKPEVAGVEPAELEDDGEDYTVTVIGSGFVPSTVGLWNDQPRATTFVSDTELEMVVTAADLAGGNDGDIAVETPGDNTTNADIAGVVGRPVRGRPPRGGGRSHHHHTHVRMRRVVTVEQVAPLTALANGAAFDLTITGRGLEGGIVVRWDDRPLDVHRGRQRNDPWHATVTADLLQHPADQLPYAANLTIRGAGGTLLDQRSIVVTAAPVDVVQGARVRRGHTVALDTRDNVHTSFGDVVASITNVSQDDPIALTALVYSSNPMALGGTGKGFDLGASFIDLKVGGLNQAPGTFRRKGRQSLTATFFSWDDRSQPARLKYWNGRGFEPVLSSGGRAPTWKEVHRHTAAATVVFDDTSQPKLRELSGTVFGADALDDVPPVVIPTTTGQLGANGFYRSDATVAFDVSDGSDVTQSPDCAGAVVALDTAGRTLTCTATDAAGNSTSQSVTVARDTTPPTIQPTLTAGGAPYAPGTWARGPVTVSFACADATSGVADGACPGPATLTDDGDGQQVDSGAVCDRAGNCTHVTVGGIRIDRTAPTLVLPNDMTLVAPNGAAGAAANFTNPTAVDALSGATGAASCTPAAGATFPLGTTVVTCTAADAAGNVSTASFSVSVQDALAPRIIGIPATTTVEASGPTGAVATYAAPGALDAAGGHPPTSCTPASGSTFPLGTTTVRCTAGAPEHLGVATFRVVVRDTTPPAFAGVPADLTVAATSARGAAVTYAVPTATDAVSAGVPASCTPASGATLPLGATLVTCRAADAAGNVARASFRVNVVDAAKPTLTLPGDQTVEATGPNGAVVPFQVAAADPLLGAASWSCDHGVDAIFPIGTTTVACTASNPSGGKTTGSFAITVRDTTPPVVDPVDDVVAEAAGPDGAVVTYTAPAAYDRRDGAVATSCQPASGARFPIGTTVVTCTAADAAGNRASGGFAVVVGDTTAPAVTLTTGTGATAAPSGWYNAASSGSQGLALNASAKDLATGVTHLTCLDGTAGVLDVAAAAGAFALRDGTHAVACTAVDGAGNSGASVGSTAMPATYKVDQTPPTTTATVNGTTGQGGWYKAGSPVQLALAGTDATSGVAATTYALDGGAPQAYMGPVTLTDGHHAVAFGSTDAAGNVEPPRTATIDVDTTAPKTTTTLAGKQGAAGWYVGPVTLTLAPTDNLSGVAATAYSLDGGATWLPYSSPVVFAKDGAYRALVRSTDAAGNVETPPAPTTFKIDQTAPVTSAAVTGPRGNNGWFKAGAPVLVALTAKDPAAADGSSSGVAATTFTVNGGAAQPYAKPVPFSDGTYAVTFGSVDAAGNAESNPANVVALKVDQTAPTVTITGVTNGATYVLGAAPAPGFTATDAGSGVDTQGATLTKPTTASGAGTYTYTATATDRAGNTTTVSATYRLVYKFAGFDPPVAGAAFTANANQTTPIKFSLMDATGKLVGSAVATLAVDGKPAGTFDYRGNHYQLNLKLRDYGATGGGVAVVVTLDDGTTQTLTATVQ